MTPCPLLSWRSRGSLASDQVPSTPQAHLGHGLALSLDAASARPAGGGPALGDGLDHTPPSRGLGHPDQGLRRPSSQTPHPLHHCHAALVQGNAACSPALVPPQPPSSRRDRESWRTSIQGQWVLPESLGLQLPLLLCHPQRLLPSGRAALLAGPAPGAGLRAGGGTLPSAWTDTQKDSREISIRKLWEMNLFLP